MTDIVENLELDRDTVPPEILDQQFDKKYYLLTEQAVSLEKAYIKALAGTKSLKVAVSLSDNNIEVYELNNTSLTKICKLGGHEKTVTELVYSPKEDNVLYSASHDGHIKLWDSRSGECAQEYIEESTQSCPYECLDVSCNGRVVCAGTQLVQDDAYLVFWDQRRPENALGGYWNSHQDDITQVKFHKQRTETLATGSTDGLLNVFNILQTTEDDALTYSLNVENSIEKITWLDEKRVSCVTHAHDLQLWDAVSGDLIKCYSRDKVARSIRRRNDEDCYLIDACAPADDVPVLLAGSYGGNGNTLRSVRITEKTLKPSTNFVGNKQIVRNLFYEKDRDILITTGESGLISVWEPGRQGPGEGVAKKLHSFNKLHVNRQKPY